MGSHGGHPSIGGDQIGPRPAGQPRGGGQPQDRPAIAGLQAGAVAEQQIIGPGVGLDKHDHIGATGAKPANQFAEHFGTGL